MEIAVIGTGFIGGIIGNALARAGDLRTSVLAGRIATAV
jgi:ketopantoate reductase